ncbi:MAG: hypothetical protein JST87_13740 [Bacteroidetes bacterium]|nr:hypothetical protein [Bacteroidota bacterium]
MTTTAIRKKLQDYIRVADERKLKAIYTILEDQISGDEWWKNKSLVKELDARYNNLQSGKDNGASVSKLKINIDKLQKKIL